jgi:hypothetical protein
VARSLSLWPLGWIAATTSGRIFFFFAEKVVGKGGGRRHLFVEGGWWAAVNGGVWVFSHLFGWLISLLGVLILFYICAFFLIV